jgi:hypothetical protein
MFLVGAKVTMFFTIFQMLRLYLLWLMIRLRRTWYRMNSLILGCSEQQLCNADYLNAHNLDVVAGTKDHAISTS